MLTFNKQMILTPESNNSARRIYGASRMELEEEEWFQSGSKPTPKDIGNVHSFKLSATVDVTLCEEEESFTSLVGSVGIDKKKDNTMFDDLHQTCASNQMTFLSNRETDLSLNV